MVEYTSLKLGQRNRGFSSVGRRGAGREAGRRGRDRKEERGVPEIVGVLMLVLFRFTTNFSSLDECFPFLKKSKMVKTWESGRTAAQM